MSINKIPYVLIVIIFTLLPAISRAEIKYDSQRDFNNRITDLFQIFYTTTVNTHDPINDAVIFQDALYLYDPTLHRIYVDAYKEDLTMQANYLMSVSNFLSTSYSEPLEMLSLSIKQSVEGMWTIDDAIAGIPQHEYNLNDPPLYIQWDYNKFYEYQRFQYLLLGYFGDSGVAATIELYQFGIPAFGAQHFYTWVVLGDRAVEILERMIANDELESGIKFDAALFIEEWNDGRIRNLYVESTD